jgi:hypothetical protein
MSRRTTSRSTARTLVLVLISALTTVGLIGPASPAGATTGKASFTCSYTDLFTMMRHDYTVPATFVIGVPKKVKAGTVVTGAKITMTLKPPAELGSVMYAIGTTGTVSNLGFKVGAKGQAVGATYTVGGPEAARTLTAVGTMASFALTKPGKVAITGPTNFTLTPTPGGPVLGSNPVCQSSKAAALGSITVTKAKKKHK